MLEGMGETWVEIACVLFVVVAAGVGGAYAYRASRGNGKKHLASLKERGYVIHVAHEKNTGPVTRIWAPFKEAVPLYVHVSNRDLVQVLAGRLGIKDIKTGNGEFDRAFVVRSNRPDQVKALLSPTMQTRLLKFGDIAFLTGSNESLICVDIPHETADERKLRQYWMIVTQGELSEEEAQPLLEFGRELAGCVEDLCRKQPASSVKELSSAPFEGR